MSIYFLSATGQRLRIMTVIPVRFRVEDYGRFRDTAASLIYEMFDALVWYATAEERKSVRL